MQELIYEFNRIIQTKSMLKNVKSNVDKALRKRRLRRMWRFFAALFVVFIIAQLVLLYFANPILKNTIQNKIENATEGVFTVDFDRISINISRFTVSLTNFKLTPNQHKYDSLKQAGLANKALYAINFSKLEFKNISIFKALKTGNLKVERIYLEKPLIRLLDLPYQAEDTLSNNDKEKYDAVHNDLFPLIESALNSLEIAKVVIKEGYFNFYVRKDKRALSSAANKISIILTNFYLDENAYKSHDKVFYSDDIDILINDYVLGLKDNIHVIRAKEVGISTRTSRIVAKSVSMLPEKVKKRNLKRINKNYFKARLPRINIEGINIANIYFSKKVALNRMTILQPVIDVFNAGIKKNEEDKPSKNIDIYELMEGKFKELSVELFSLQNAEVNIRDIKTPKQAQTAIGNLTILLDNFLLDSLASQNENKILYADNIDLSLLNYKMQLRDKLHVLSADELFFSTETKKILAKNVKLEPGKGGGESRYNIDVPRLELNGADFIEAFNHNKLSIREFKLDRPTIDIEQFISEISGKQRNKHSKRKQSGLAHILDDYLKRVDIEILSMTNADFNVGTHSANRQKTRSSGRMKLSLFNFSFNVEKKNIWKNSFNAEDIDLRFSDYSTKLNDNLHQLNVDSICLSSVDSLVFLRGVHFSPILSHTPVNLLRAHKKSALMDIEVNEIKIDEANLMQIYFDKKLVIDKIEINTPDINLLSYPQLKRIFKAENDSIDTENQKKNSDIVVAVSDSLVVDTLYTDYYGVAIAANIDSVETDIKDNIAQLISTYYDIVSVNEISLNVGKILYRNVDTLQQTQLALSSKFDIKLDSFLLDTSVIDAKNRLFFSENIALNLHKYRLDMPQNIYDVEADNIHLSTQKASVVAQNFIMKPKILKANSEQKNAIVSLKIPVLSFNNIDINAATKLKILDAGSVILDKPEITLINRKQYKNEKDTTKKRKNFIAAPKGIQLIDFDSIMLKNGAFVLKNENDTASNIVSKTSFSLEIDHFKLDEKGTTFDTKEIPFVDNILLTLNNYSFKLVDSIHTFGVERMSISTKKGEINANGLRITHRKDIEPATVLIKNDKFNLYDFDIQKFKIKGLDFDKFYGYRAVDVELLQIENADITIDNYPELKDDSDREPLVQPKDGQIVPPVIDFYKFISPDVGYIKANNLVFRNINLGVNKHFEAKEDADSLLLNQISGDITGLFINKNSHQNKSKFYSSDNIKFSIKDYEIPLDNSYSDIKIGEAGFSLSDSLIFANNFMLVPRGGLANVASKYKFQRGIATLDANKVKVKGVDFKRLLESKELFARKMLLDSVLIDIYKDKELPFNETAHKPLLHSAIHNLNQFVKLDTVVLKHTKINYTENAVSELGLSYLTLDSVEAEVTNVTNDDVQLLKNNIMKADISGYLMNKGKIDIELFINLTSEDSLYTMKGQLGEMDLTLLNDYLQKSAFIEIKDGKLNSATFDIEGDDSLSTGNIIMRYEDLKIAMLNREGNVGAAQAVYGLIANSLLRSDNPKRKNLIPRHGPVYSIRNSAKSVVNQWISALLTGIKSTLGFQPRELRKQIRQQNRKEKKERRMKLLHLKNRSKWEKIREKEQKILEKTKRKLRKQYKRQNKKAIRRERRLQRKVNRKMNELLELEIKEK